MSPALFEQMQNWFVSMPHCATLGMRPAGLDEGRPTLAIDWRDELVGNPVTGVLHGGAITSLIDTTSGLALFARLDQPEAIATLDLRIDYLRPATPGRTVIGRGECLRIARSIAFTRGIAHDGDIDDPIAHVAASFMVPEGTYPRVKE